MVKCDLTFGSHCGVGLRAAVLILIIRAVLPKLVGRQAGSAPLLLAVTGAAGPGAGAGAGAPVAPGTPRLTGGGGGVGGRGGDGSEESNKQIPGLFQYHQ